MSEAREAPAKLCVSNWMKKTMNSHSGVLGLGLGLGLVLVLGLGFGSGFGLGQNNGLSDQWE